MTTETIFYLIAKVLLDASRVEGTQISIPNCGDVPYCVGRQPTGQETLAFSAFAMRNLRPVFSAANPFECLQLVVESILAAIGKRRILLMLDEFDKLQVGIDTGATSPLVPENLRNLFHTYPQVSGILAGSRRMRELRNQYFNALFGLGKSLRVSSLDAASATQLITDPVKGKLVYTPQAVEFILRETACQPFLLQGVCDQVFSLCSTSAADRAVTLTIAERAAGVFSQDNEHFSQVWFDDVKTDLRHFTLCLIDTYTGGPDPLTAEFIFTQLERSGIGRVDLKQLGDDLDELAGLEVLVHDREGLQTTYRINIPLLSRWMRQNIDFGRYKLAAKMETE
jgi:type I restriction enzyme M protein